MKKVLIIGSGGREHALAWKLSQSDQVSQVFVAPGNAGTGKDYTNVAIDVMDFSALADFVESEGVDLTVVGPEDPLAAGIVDYFRNRDLVVFGPDQACAQFEASKDFTKQFLYKYDIPTARSFTSNNFEQAMEYLKGQTFPVVIKADGLYKGKGVVICEDFESAQATLEAMLVQDRFGAAGTRVVIEDYLTGSEQSLLCFVSDNKLVPMETACDYKKALDGDLGLNTGGVGVYSPGPDASSGLAANIQAILDKINAGLEAEGYHFFGILFIGFMIENDQPKVLEFNVRFGDPETEALMPRLESDLYQVFEKCLAGTLEADDLVWSEDATVGVVLHSKGYPENYENNVPIHVVPEVDGEDAVIFHNGTRMIGDQMVTMGGRVLTPVCKGSSLEEARLGAYKIVEQIQGPSLIYRTDIGKV